MLFISEKDLVKINDITAFYSAKAVCYIDLLEIPAIVPDSFEVLSYKGKRYLNVALCGKPDNLVKNSPVLKQTSFGWISFGIDSDNLLDAISKGNIFDLSKFYRNLKYCRKVGKEYEYNFRMSNDFIINNFLIPYL